MERCISGHKTEDPDLIREGPPAVSTPQTV